MYYYIIHINSLIQFKYLKRKKNFMSSKRQHNGSGAFHRRESMKRIIR